MESSAPHPLRATCGAGFSPAIDAAVNADAEGLRRAGLVAQRMGFAFELAVFVTKDGTEQDADQFLSGWDDECLRDIRNIVNQARREAADQLDALADQKDAKSHLFAQNRPETSPENR